MNTGMTDTQCSQCNGLVSYSKSYCICGAFVGFPNFRGAMAEADDLDGRYQRAKARFQQNKCLKYLPAIEVLADKSLPIINMSCGVVDDLLRNAKYRNYHSLYSDGLREAAARDDHRKRLTVEASLFTGYEGKIVYAALSHTGFGLSSYVTVSVAWNVNVGYLKNRTTVHEENSFAFYDRHNLGEKGKDVPRGYFSVWEDRKKIAVAKLANQVFSTKNKTAIETLFFSSQQIRADDSFIEVCLFFDEGAIHSRDIQSIRSEVLYDHLDKDRYDLVKATAKSRNIDCT